MAEFIEKEVVSVRDYDLYCHYVAGLVGIGLCQVCDTLACTPGAHQRLTLDHNLSAQDSDTYRRMQKRCTIHATASLPLAIRDESPWLCSCLRPASWRARTSTRWRTWPTTWASFCRRPTSSGTILRTSMKSLLPGTSPHTAQAACLHLGPAVCISWHPVTVAPVCTAEPVCGRMASKF